MATNAHQYRPASKQHCTAPIYVINLKDSPRRLSHMQQQMDLLQLTFKRINAVSVSSPKQIKRHTRHWNINPSERSRNMGYGDIGQYASHRIAWLNLVKSNQPFAIVLEDDVIVSPDLYHIVEHINQLPRLWDIIRLDQQRRYPYPKFVPLALPFGANQQIRLSPFSQPSCKGYIITQQTASRLLTLTRRFSVSLPNDLQNLRAANISMLDLFPHSIHTAINIPSDRQKINWTHDPMSKQPHCSIKNKLQQLQQTIEILDTQYRRLRMLKKAYLNNENPSSKVTYSP